MGIVKTEFFPNQDQGTFSVLLELPPGTNLDTMQRAAAQVEAKLLDVPEVQTVFAQVGQGENTTQRQPRYAQLFVALVPKHQRTRTADQVARQSRDFGGGIPGLKLRPGVASAGGGSAQPILIRISGDDLATLTRLADQVTGALANLGTLTDLTNS